jgi:hypothetical protein
MTEATFWRMEAERHVPAPQGISVPLTCEYCRNSPATCLIAVDFEYSRVKAVVCEPCGRRALPDAAKVAKVAWLFTLTPALPVSPQEG